MEYKHFTLHRWSFKNDNLKALYKSLTEADKETFDFDLWNVSNASFRKKTWRLHLNHNFLPQMDWRAYIKSYALGLRTFVAKDPPETIPKARKLLKK